MLHHIVELVRVAMCLESSMIPSHLFLLREYNLNQLYHMFIFLKKHHNSELVFDSSGPAVDVSEFEQRDCVSSEFGHALNERTDLPAKK